MIWTNKQELPYPVVRAATLKTYSKGDADFSVTELNQPVRMRQLIKRHGEKIVRDVADELASLMGTALHLLFHQHYDPCDMAEQVIHCVFPVDGKLYKVKGQPDLYSKLEGNTLFDYKFTSVWAWIMGGKIEWERQLNVYRYMLTSLGQVVDKIEAVGFWKDWKKREARFNDDYPRANSTKVRVQMWQDGPTLAYVQNRIRAHVAAESLPDEQLPDCTEEERWTRGESYAVMKAGTKKAVRVFHVADFGGDRTGAMNTAAKLARDKGAGHSVIKRPAENPRCADWCDAAPFCSQYIKILEGSQEEPKEAVG